MTFKGVTLKHVVDHFFNFQRVKHESDCPTHYADSYWHKLHEIAGNINAVYTPAEGPRLPDLWNDWRHQWTPLELEQMELGVRLQAEFTHIAKDPMPLQPSKISICNHYHTFLVSPVQSFTYLKVVGKNYTFSDRF